MPSYRNHEGYPDPTAYEALRNIERRERAINRYRPLVYICSPYAGDIRANIRAARKYSRFAATQGCIPLAPHLLFPQFLDDSNVWERKLGLRFGIVLLTKCVEVWVFGDRISAGMQEEIRKAKLKNRRIRYFTEDCKEVEK